MKQKLFTLFLTLAASAGTIFADGTKIGDLYYNLDAVNKTAEVTYEEYLDFANYSSLTTANIPSSVDYESVPYSVTSIGDWAFAYCYGLTSVTIPNSVTEIGDGAFAYCSGLTSISVDASNQNYCDMDGVLFNKEQTTLIQYPAGKSSTEYSIPNSVTSIENYAFAGCSGLTSVTIPNSVTSIGYGAFSDCSGLTSVTIGNSVTSIGYAAFFGCTGLTSVTIGNSVTSIGEYAFQGCYGLTSVTIPNSVTSIGDEAFYGCSGLTSITCEASTPPACESGVFVGVDKSIPLYVPAESVEAYKAADKWKAFTNIQPIQAEEIPDHYYYYKGYVDGYDIETYMVGVNTFEGGIAHFSCSQKSYIFIVYQEIGVLGIEYALNAYTEESVAHHATLYKVPNPFEKMAFEPGDYTLYLYDNGDGTLELSTIVLPGKNLVDAENALPTYTITTQSYNIKRGTVSGGGVFTQNAQIEISATANPGYRFKQWQDGNKDNPRNVVVTQDSTFTAYFTDASIYWEETFDGNGSTYIEKDSTGAWPYASGDATTMHVFDNYSTDYTNIDSYYCSIRSKKIDGNTKYTPGFCFMQNRSAEKCYLTLDYPFIADGAEASLLFEICSDATIVDTDLSKMTVKVNDMIAEIPAIAFPQISYTTTVIVPLPKGAINKLHWEFDSVGQRIFLTHPRIVKKSAVNQYTIEVAADDNKGSVIGGGIYHYGSVAILTATPNVGFQFNSWSDGNTDNPRYVEVVSDAVYTAMFGPKMCQLTVKPNDILGGAVSGGGIFEYGTQVTVTANENSGYQFIKWSNGATYNPYKFTIVDDMELVAFFQRTEADPVNVDEVVVTPDENSANIQWPQVDNAYTYTLIIWADAAQTEKVCTLVFDASGRLTSINFNKKPRKSPAHTEQLSGFSFTVTGLDENTEYFYSLAAKDEHDILIGEEEKGSFTTKSTATGVEDIIEQTDCVQKVLRNGQLYILRNGEVYNAQGARVE